MRSHSFMALNAKGFHRVAYHEWGSADNDRVLVCVHGLARNSRDFDDIALALSRDYRVVCPDIVGRGTSDWLPEGVPYQISQYLQDMTALIARLNVPEIDWLGTSMGGIIGMCLAAQPKSPVRRLVMNDIGAFVPSRALQRIGLYVGQSDQFNDLDAVEAYYREVYAAYRGISDKQWRHLAQHGSRELPSGEWVLNYDPVIGDYTRASSAEDIDLWPVWRQVRCPQMLMWGEESDVLDQETVAGMRAECEALTVNSWPGIGHAPSLMEPEQIQAVVNWLRTHRDRSK